MAEPKRANWFVRQGRRVGNLFRTDSRIDPTTGRKQQKLGMRGGFVDMVAAERPHPKPGSRSSAAGYLSAPPRPKLVRQASAAIGMGRIGVGEGIGTTRGTRLESWKGGRTTVGERGIIGFSRIGGDTPLRGSASSAAGASGSGS